MSGAGLPGTIDIVQTAANGAHVPAKRNGASKRSGAAAAPAAAPQPLAGPVAGIGAAPVDAPMWPVHSAAWFQPEVAPSAPAWSGLGIERHARIPAPDFLPPDTAPANRPGTCENEHRAFTPAARPETPESGLTPLGWDPRAVFWKEKPA
jgi:hypothetical protein